jgi:hypothetical protein
MAQDLVQVRIAQGQQLQEEMLDLDRIVGLGEAELCRALQRPLAGRIELADQCLDFGHAGCR